MLNKATTKKDRTKVKAVFAGCFLASVVLMGCGNAGSEPVKNTADSTAATAEAPAEKKAEVKHYTSADLVDLDLSAHGYPLIVKAPKDAKVVKSTLSDGIAVDGGKAFGLTISKNEGTDAAYMHDGIKKLEATPESMFAKFEAEDKTGFIKKNTEGKFSFKYYVEAGKDSYTVVEGIPFDLADPNDFDLYTFTLDDIKVMYEAAKATKLKK
jgi:hypothetical protein